MPDDILERAARAMEGIVGGDWWYSEYSRKVHAEPDAYWPDGLPIATVLTHAGTQVRANARFIASAPGLVRDLMAEIERLRMGGRDGDNDS